MPSVTDSLNPPPSRRILKAVPISRQPGNPPAPPPVFKPGQLLVLFDGECILCNGVVRWLIARDTRARLRFAAARSPQAAPYLPAALLSNPAPASVLVVRNPATPLAQVLQRSSAVVAVLAELPRPWPAIAAAVRLIPRPMRDVAYRLVARLRYRHWGRYPSCPLPAPAHRAKFL